MYRFKKQQIAILALVAYASSQVFYPGVISFRRPSRGNPSPVLPQHILDLQFVLFAVFPTRELHMAE